MNKNLFLRNVATIVVCLAVVMTSAFFVGCDKNNDGEDEGSPASTETTEEFDNSNFGLYKGTIAGSTGSVKIELNNGNAQSKATLIIDGRTDALTCNSVVEKGKAVVNALFEGSFSSFTFSVSADGKNSEISDIRIEGHENVIGVIIKETSTDVATVYEGTYSGGNNASGVFNLVRKGNAFSGVYKGADGISSSFVGSITNETCSGNGKTKFNGLDVTTTMSGKFTGDNCSGTWTTSWKTGEGTQTNSGSFSGRKTL